MIADRHSSLDPAEGSVMKSTGEWFPIDVGRFALCLLKVKLQNKTSMLTIDRGKVWT